MSYIYLASPYSAKARILMEARYVLACAYTAEIIKAGIPVYSPIVHWHEVAEQWGLPGHADFWWYQNRAMIKHCFELWVITMPGWEWSSGVQQEVEYAQSRMKPIRYASTADKLLKEFYRDHPTFKRI